jgi:glucose/arabinose dehydrogenase
MKEVDIKLIADNFVSPIGLVALPDKSGKFDDRDEDHDRRGGHDNKKEDERLFVIDQVGRIWIIDEHGNKLPVPFLDITSKIVPLSPGYDERGLLGLAFHPDFKKNGRFFVYYTAPPRAGGPEPGALWNNLSRISEFRVSALNPNLADMTFERPILELNDPQSNHNGGTIAFGDDGYLYIAIGDGGGANDVGPGHVEDWYTVNRGGNGQDVEANLFGNFLRLDVNHGRPYGIPHDNPFVGRRGLDEIYAYGFRNPFRFSFDMGGSHQLIAGDAGQLLYEEIDLVKKGGNYGWNVKEGRHCFNTDSPLVERGSCPMVDPFGNVLRNPVIELNNWQNPKGGKATTVIGGNVYRGHSIPQFEGKYIFGTFSQSIATPDGELFIANRTGENNWPFQEISLRSSPNDVGYYLKGFGQDQDGEIYLTVSKRLGPAGLEGKVFKLVPVRNKDEDEDD